MRKHNLYTAAILVYMSIPVASQALSLEAKAMIEEIRNRLQNRQKVVQEQILSENDYIPGFELRNAIGRLRSRLYPGKSPYNNLTAVKTSLRKVQVDENTGTIDDYVPGSHLAASLEKIRSRREIIKMIKLIKATKAANHIPQISTAYPEPVDTDNSQKAPLNEPLSQTRDQNNGENVVSIHQKRRSSAQLLKAAELKLDRKLIHQEDNSRSNAQVPPPAAQPLRKEEEDDSEVNHELSKFEFKMPSNYRIRVQ